jgi:hypothetical protein
MDNESEVAYVRAVMDNLPTLARSPVPGRVAGPKMGKVFGPYNTRVYGIHSEGDPVQSNVLRPRKMDARNGGTRQRLSRRGVGGQAVCLGGEDGSRSKGSAVMVEIRRREPGTREGRGEGGGRVLWRV